LVPAYRQPLDLTKEIDQRDSRRAVTGFYSNDPAMVAIKEAARAHIIRVHGFKENPLSIDHLFCVIDHMAAVISGRRSLDELKQ